MPPPPTPGSRQPDGAPQKIAFILLMMVILYAAMGLG